MFWFTNTLRVIEPSVNYCDGCGEPVTSRIRDEEQQEFFLCDGVDCADWAQPAEQHDISAADWEPFAHPRPRAKAPRLEVEYDYEEDNYNDEEADFDEEEEGNDEEY